MKRIATLAVGAFLHFGAAHANSVTINYYTINPADPDANHLAGGTFTNEVQNVLGPNGLPVLNIPQYGCKSNCFSVNGAPGFPNGGSTPNVNVLNQTGEITYWSTQYNPFVKFTGSANVSLPINFSSNFFPPNGTGSSDANGYQAATIMASLNAQTAQKLNFTIGSDDMAFAYIDGKLVCSDGGVHPAGGVPCTTATISAGSHQLALFFVDINQVQSALTFSMQSTNVTLSAVPEPATLAVLGVAVAGVAAMRRRRAAV